MSPAPSLQLEVDRTRLAENGISQQNLANDVMITLVSSTQVTPNYWVDPIAGRPYLVAVKTLGALVDSPMRSCARADRHQDRSLSQIGRPAMGSTQ